MGKIRDYIEINILEKLWKPLPKGLKTCIIFLTILIMAIVFVPFLFPKYKEWKANVESIFDSKKQVQSDNIVSVDSIPPDTVTIIKPPPPPPCDKNPKTQELVNEAREMKNLSQADGKYQEAYNKLSKLCQDKYKQRKDTITSTFDLTTRVKKWRGFFEDIGY